MQGTEAPSISFHELWCQYSLGGLADSTGAGCGFGCGCAASMVGCGSAPQTSRLRSAASTQIIEISQHSDIQQSARCGSAPQTSGHRSAAPMQAIEISSDLSASISIGRLPSCGDLLGPSSSANDDILYVRVDRAGSAVGSPFASAPDDHLASAYDDVIRMALALGGDFWSAGEHFADMHAAYLLGARHDDGLALRQALRAVASRHGAELHRDPIELRVLRVWLSFHASQLLQGATICLLCWCMDGWAPPGTCHAQCLAGALLWLVSERTRGATHRFHPMVLPPLLLACIDLLAA